MKQKCLLWAIVVAAVCYAISTVTGQTYQYVDNVTVALVTNGYFGSSVFCQYLHPAFCLLVYGLSRLFPTADMFAVTVHVLIFFAFVFLAFLGFRGLPQSGRTVMDKVISGAAVILGILYLSFCINLWNVNYTVQTAAFVFAGMIGLFRDREHGHDYIGSCREHGRDHVGSCRENRIIDWISILFISMGFLMRNPAALLFVPYFLLQIIAGACDSCCMHSKEAQKNLPSIATAVRHSMQRVLPCVCICILLMAAQGAFYLTEPHAQDKIYNDARTAIVDFPMKVWDEAKDDLADHPEIDETEYEAVQRWILADTEIMNTENLKLIADAGAANRYAYTADGLRSALADMRRRVFGTDVHLFMLLILMTVMLLKILTGGLSACRKAEAVLSVAGSWIILLYFTIRGRALWHVWYCVLMAACSILVPLSVKIQEDTHPGSAGHQNNDSRMDARNRMHGNDSRMDAQNKLHGSVSRSFMHNIGLLLICAVLYFSIGQEMMQTTIHMPRTALTARTAEPEEEYAPTYSGNAVYVWPNWQSELKSVYRKTDKLPSAEFLKHNIAMGDWTYGQEYYREYLKRLDIENPATAGLHRQDVYYMNVKDGLLLQYMKAHYGEDITFREAGNVNEAIAYQLDLQSAKGGRP